MPTSASASTPPAWRTRAARWLLPLGMVALALAPIAGGAQTDPGVEPSAALAADFERIAAEAAELRGLPLKTDIDEALLSGAALGEKVAGDFLAEYPAAEQEADRRTLEAFGMFPEGLDLGQLLTDLYSEQIAGFYDSESDEMYVISDDDDLSAEEEITLAHEVTHALQDQHFDLEKVSAGLEDNDDASLAVTSLIEGDATVLMGDYLAADLALAARMLAASVSGAAASDVFDGTPPIIQETLLFPYLGGQAFVTQLREDGADWATVDAAYADLPQSTEQILHPEKYLGERDEPTAVSLPDLGALLGAGWSELDDNTLGEFQTSVLLAGLDGENEGAEAAAAGWDGDHYAVWGDAEDEVIAWSSVWDSAGDAAEFAAALAAYDADRFEAEFADADGAQRLEVDGRVVLLEQDGTGVRYVLAPTAELADEVFAALAG